MIVKIKASVKDAVIPLVPVELKQGPGAYVMKSATSSFFFGSAHTLVHVADIVAERTKKKEKGYEGHANNFPAQDVRHARRL